MSAAVASGGSVVGLSGERGTGDSIGLRFSLFFLSSLALLGLIAHAWVAVM